jgi:hypothetical protein
VTCPRGLRLALEAEKVAQRLGTKVWLRWTRGALVGLWFELGNWEQCGSAADEILAESAARGPHYSDTFVRCCRSWLRLARGDMPGALEDQQELLISARQAKDPQTLYPALAFSACVLAAAGRAEQARQLLSELFSTGPVDRRHVYETFTEGVPAAEILGCRDQARRWLGTRRDSPWFAAARELAEQDFVAAAESLDSIGAARSAALARLRAAQELVKAGRPGEAEDQLQHALKVLPVRGRDPFHPRRTETAGRIGMTMTAARWHCAPSTPGRSRSPPPRLPTRTNGPSEHGHSMRRDAIRDKDEASVPIVKSLAGWSQVEDQVVVWLRAADQCAAVGGVVDRGGGIADCSGYDGCLAGVAHSGAA